MRHPSSHAIPSATALRLWRAHFVLSVVANALAMGWSLLGPATDSERVPTFDISPLDVAVIGLGMMLAIGPFVAEWGYIAQRKISSPGFWKVLLVVCAVLISAWVLMQVAIDASLGMRAFDSTLLVDIALGVLGLIQLWAVWLYAWRSDHLWHSTSSAMTT